jgi:hypothetical protein
MTQINSNPFYSIVFFRGECMINETVIILFVLTVYELAI